MLNDEITSGSGDASLADEVRALGALSRAKDQASQQRAIPLQPRCIETRSTTRAAASRRRRRRAVQQLSGPQALDYAGGLSALTTSQGLEFADLQTFKASATPEQSNAYLATVAGPQDDDGAAHRGLRDPANGDPRQIFQRVDRQTSLGFRPATVAATWYSDQSAVVSQMRSIETQVVDAIVARSQSLQHQAFESALAHRRGDRRWRCCSCCSRPRWSGVLSSTRCAGSRRTRLRSRRSGCPRGWRAAAAGTDAAEGPPMVEPIGVQSTDEIGRVARAFDQVHAEAVRLAGNEAQLRGSLNAMFISLSRRSVPLIERLARMIDAMEQNEDDPDQLAKLFSMDHLVTRMRRNSENLLVLAGEEPVRKWTDSVPLTDVARAAASEIEQYSRVALAVQPGIMISGQAAADVVHLLAELIENATLFSPQSTQVRVTVMELSSGGVLVEVRDDGVGVSPSRLADMNWRLDHPPVVDVSISRHMGLYAVSRLAARHGIRVKLRPGTPQGLSALVWLPGTLAKREPAPAASGHSRPFGLDATGPVPGIRPAAPARPVTGRHRSGLAVERRAAARGHGRAGRAGRPRGRRGVVRRQATVKRYGHVRGGAGGRLADRGQLADGGGPRRDGRRRSPRRTGRTDELGPATAGAEDECPPRLGHARLRLARHGARCRAADAGVPVLGAPLAGWPRQGVPYQEARRRPGASTVTPALTGGGAQPPGRVPAWQP